MRRGFCQAHAARNDGVKGLLGEVAADFVPDVKMADAPPETRALADLCVVLFNTNEFAYVY